MGARFELGFALSPRNSPFVARVLAATFPDTTAPQPLVLDALVVTHGDADHYRGLFELDRARTYRDARRELHARVDRYLHNGLGYDLSIVGSSPIDLLSARLVAAIDRISGRPVSHQLVELVWSDVLDGTLEVGTRLPTVRRLAVELGVQPRVVERAFQELTQRGVVRADSGGWFVCVADGDEAARHRARTFEALCLDTVERAEALGYGIDDVLEELSDLRDARRSPESR